MRREEEVQGETNMFSFLQKQKLNGNTLSGKHLQKKRIFAEIPFYINA